MSFVYSNWYIVMALLVVAIVALVTVFILMDKKDKKLIEEFVASSQAKEETNSVSVATEAETKTEEKVNE